ncbi:MAG: phosphotransferase [Oscillospiraceae bacterium]|nr:phosphotransferase [Oscillospiraceae bacterium]
MNTRQAVFRIFGEMPVSVTAEPLTDDKGISSRISAGGSGVKRYRAVFPGGREICFIGKRKSVRVIANGIRMICGKDAVQTVQMILRHKIFGYNGSAVREARLYGKKGVLPRALIPEVLGSAEGILQGSCLIAMRELPESEPAAPALFRILEQIVRLHAKYYRKTALLRRLGVNCYTESDYRKTAGILLRMFDRLDAENRIVFSAGQIAEIRRFIQNIGSEFAAVSQRRTLTHNDCCARNLCISGSRICLYDWELACCQNPEHDVIELLISVMDALPDETVLRALDHCRSRLAALTGVTLTDAEYQKILRFNTLEYCVNKLALLRYAGRSLHDSTPLLTAKNTARMLRLLGLS